MEIKRATIQKYMSVLNDAFENQKLFKTQDQFRQHYKVDSYFAPNCVKAKVLIKTNLGYKVTNAVTYTEVKRIAKQTAIEKGYFNNNRKYAITDISEQPKIEIKVPKVERVVTERHQQTIEETSGGWSILWGLVKVNAKTRRIKD